MITDLCTSTSKCKAFLESVCQTDHLLLNQMAKSMSFMSNVSMPAKTKNDLKPSASIIFLKISHLEQPAIGVKTTYPDFQMFKAITTVSKV